MKRKIVAYTEEDLNDILTLTTALQEHKKAMQKPSKVSDPKRRKSYIERIDKMIDFYKKLWVELS